MTLSLVLTYVFIIDEEKGKYRPALYVFLVICLFYIKQYFVFAALGVFVALLRRSKKVAVEYCFRYSTGGCFRDHGPDPDAALFCRIYTLDARSY